MHPDDISWIRRIVVGELDHRLELWHVLDRVATAASRMGGQVAICGTFVGADIVEVRGALPMSSRRCPACQGDLARGAVAVPVAVSAPDGAEERV